MKLDYTNLHPLGKLAITALMAAFGLLLFMILGVVIAIPIFGLSSFSKLMSAGITFSAENINLLKYFQMVQSIGIFIVPAIVLAFLFGAHPQEYLYVHNRPYLSSIILAVLIIWASSPIINLLGIWNESMSFPSWLSGVENWMKKEEESAGQLTTLFLETKTTGGLILNILMIGIIPAIGEELLFRGIIQRIFTEWFKNHHWGIWMTAIIFSALHMQFFGFLPRALLGVLFGYLLVWSKNLWLPITAHFINNTTAVLAYYLFGKGVIQTNPDTLGTDSQYGLAAIISTFFVAALCIALKRNESKFVNLYPRNNP
jgi:uncharacterized protein